METSDVINQDQAYASPYQVPQNMKDSTMIFMTNPEEELKKIELTLRGLYENDEGEIKRYGKELVNEHGIQAILGLIRSVVSQINIMGQEEGRDVNLIMLDYVDTLIKFLMTQRKEIGLSRANRDLVFILAKYPAYFSLRRSLNGGERQFWGKIQQEVKHVVEQSGNNGGGIFSRFANFGSQARR